MYITTVLSHSDSCLYRYLAYISVYFRPAYVRRSSVPVPTETKRYNLTET